MRHFVPSFAVECAVPWPVSVAVAVAGIVGASTSFEHNG